MVNEFKAEMIKGQLVVKPIIKKNGNDVTIVVPGFKLMSEIKDKYKQDNK